MYVYSCGSILLECPAYHKTISLTCVPGKKSFFCPAWLFPPIVVGDSEVCPWRPAEGNSCKCWQVACASVLQAVLTFENGAS